MADLYDELYGSQGAKPDLASALYGPTKIGRDAFPDAIRREMEDAGWVGRNLAGAGAALDLGANALKQLFGQGDAETQRNIENSRVIAQEAPIGNVVGNVAMLAPAMAIPGANTIAGQAVVGAVQGGVLTPGSLEERIKNAAADAALNAAGQGVATLGVKVANKIGSMGSLERARKILSDVIGGDSARAERLALQARGTGLSTPQALEQLDNPTLMAMARATESINPEASAHYYRLAQMQEGNRLSTMNMLAGADNQAGANAGLRTAKNALNAEATPMRETELAAANAASKYGVPLQNEADTLAAAAANKVGDVRKFSNLEDVATNAANTWEPTVTNGAVGLLPRYAPNHPAYMRTYAGELAKRAEKLGLDAADESLILGEGARFTQARADSLAAHGLNPLDTSSVRRYAMGELNNPSMAGNSLNKGALTTVLDDIAEWTAKNGGIIDAAALDAIRKNSVSNFVRQRLAGATPKIQDRAAAEIVSGIKPLIDNAIEAAGGTGWKDYLKFYTEGMRDINQKQFFAKALDAYNQSPAAFQKLVGGNNPKAVEKIFGYGNDDITKLLGPDALFKLEKVSKELTRDAKIGEMEKAGQQAFGKVLQENTASTVLPSFISPKITIANAFIRGGEAKVNRATMQALEKAMRSPQEFGALLRMLPVEERNTILRNLNQYGGVYGAPGAIAQTNQ